MRALEATLGFLASVSEAEVAADDQVDATVRAAMTLRKTGQMLQFLTLACMAARRGDLLQSVLGHAGEVQKLRARVATSPVSVLNRCQVLMTEARRIHQEVAPRDEKKSGLEDLLDVSGQALPGTGITPTGLFEEKP